TQETLARRNIEANHSKVASHAAGTRRSACQDAFDLIRYPVWRTGMRRRDFLGLVGGASIALPLSVRAQRGEKSYRIGYLALLPGEDATFAKPFLQRL